MKKYIWIALIILSVALAQIACKTAAEREAERSQEAAESAEVAEQAEEVVEEEPVELPADTRGGIFQAAMAGIETDVKLFLEGIPVPEDGSISMEDISRMDFITSMTIDECAQFYRDTFSGLGLIEVEELGAKTDFSETLIFGGYPKGKAIRVKISNLSQFSRNIKIHILEPNDL
ncbi:MAG: hypothetical protein ISR58_03510 [Anaerolineales bacterium]|nr:hypothetical protein [Chloroflexota bacterium]MBL6980240.1 hypothetical protein [Anaerolineales bacterium]